MEPLDDRELDELLRQWRAPLAPSTLEKSVRRGRRASWWNWLLSGSVRVPVPLILTLAAAFVALLTLIVGHRPQKDVPRQATTIDFQPVKRIEPRIIRSTYEQNQ